METSSLSRTPHRNHGWCERQWLMMRHPGPHWAMQPPMLRRASALQTDPGPTRSPVRPTRAKVKRATSLLVGLYVQCQRQPSSQRLALALRVPCLVVGCLQPADMLRSWSWRFGTSMYLTCRSTSCDVGVRRRRATRLQSLTNDLTQSRWLRLRIFGLTLTPTLNFTLSHTLIPCRPA